MIVWEAHACLPLHPRADFAPIDRLHAAGCNYVSINIGMDMNPLSQVMSVIGGFRTTIAAHPDRCVLASHVEDIERAAEEGKLALGFDLGRAIRGKNQVADAFARIEHGGNQRLRGDGGGLGGRRTEELIFVDDVGSVRGAGHAHTISAPGEKALSAVLRAPTRRRCL